MRGLRPSRSFESSPIPSAASPPPIRSPETSCTDGASSCISRSVSSSGSRSSCETSRRPRTSRSGSSAKLRGETVRSTPSLQVGPAAERVDERAVGQPDGDRVHREVAAGEVVLDARVRIDDDLEVVTPGPGRTLAARRRELDPGRRERPHLRSAREEPEPDRAARDDELIDPAVRRERRAQLLGVEAGDEEVRVLRVDPEQLVADGAADEVGVEPERADVVLDRLHARIVATAARTANAGPNIARGKLPLARDSADEGDRLDLDQRARGQLRDLDRRARRRRVADVPRVDLVHAGEVVEVLEKDRRLHEPVERRARGLEDRAQVREHLLGLLGDPARDELLRAGPQRELARDEDEGRPP